MRSGASITAVIVTYNSRGDVGSALAALSAAHQAGVVQCVVADNASSDGTADFIATAHPWATLVRSRRNLGFGRGCNLGFEQVRTPYLLIQNPDAVVGVTALETLVGFLEGHQGAGIAAPAIVERGVTLQAAGLMTTPMSLVRSALGCSAAMREQERIVPGSPPFRTSWVCGAVMLIRSSLFRRLRGFDPRFFLYFEETDLCRRAADEGAEIWAVGEARVEHLGGASGGATAEALESSNIAEHFYRSRFYYLVKHFGWLPAVASEILSRGVDHLRRWRNHVSRRQPPPRDFGRRPFLKFPALPDDTL